MAHQPDVFDRILRPVVKPITGSMLIDALVNASGDDITRQIIGLGMLHYADHAFGLLKEGNEFRHVAIDFMLKHRIAPEFIVKYQSAMDWVVEDANLWITALYPNG